MATTQEIAWLTGSFFAAKLATEGAPWLLKITPEQYAAAAACEAAAETGWGAHMPPNSNNVLGIKAYRGWTGKVVTADGTEQNADGSYTGPQSDLWCVFDSIEACFAEQLMILQEPRYAQAAEATTIEAYILAECAVWSTGLQKGQVVTQIYEAHKDVLA
jgi:hypothetical protein